MQPTSRRRNSYMPITSVCGRAMVASLLGLLAACSDLPHAGERTPVDVRISARPGVLTAPDSVRPGWVRVGVEELEDTHIVVVFRVPAMSTDAEVTAFVAALDTAPVTPRPGVAIGGPEVGARGDVIVHLTPGVYVLACVRRGADGHRHALRGESKRFTVLPVTSADSAKAAPPRSAQAIRMVDFAYVGPDHWVAGAQLLRIENTGVQDHQLRLARLRDGATLRAWMTADNQDTVATTVAGMARMSPGEVAYLPLDLTPGNYIVYCLVADKVTHRQHVELGMLRSIQVP